MCLYKLATEAPLLCKQRADMLPSNCYPLLLTEAIYLRESSAIEWIVSCWPMRVMRLYDLVPLEVRNVTIGPN